MNPHTFAHHFVRMDFPKSIPLADFANVIVAYSPIANSDDRNLDCWLEFPTEGDALLFKLKYFHLTDRD